MGADTPEVFTVTHVAVEITPDVTQEGMNKLLFNRCTPPSWSCEAPKHDFHGEKGAIESIISSVQNAKHGTVELTQGWDEGMALAKWKALIMDESKTIDEKKKDIKISFLNSKGDALFVWHAEKALLTSYNHAGSDASSNGILTVTATIDADKWEHCDAQGQPITA
jgi:phage tail-like protein